MRWVDVSPPHGGDSLLNPFSCRWPGRLLSGGGAERVTAGRLVVVSGVVPASADWLGAAGGGTLVPLWEPRWLTAVPRDQHRWPSAVPRQTAPRPRLIGRTRRVMCGCAGLWGGRAEPLDVV